MGLNNALHTSKGRTWTFSPAITFSVTRMKAAREWMRTTEKQYDIKKCKQQTPREMCCGAASSFTRADFDKQYEIGACPLPPHRNRKWNYLPWIQTGTLHHVILIALRIPLTAVLFALALIVNLFSLVQVYAWYGGAIQYAERTTQPEGNILIRWVLSLVDVFNVIEIPRAWNEEDAKQAFERMRIRNGYTNDELQVLTWTIPDSVSKQEVMQKWHKADRYPATLHHAFILCAPNKTFVITLTNFVYDGTSCFNLTKALIESYYSKEAPLVRPRKNDKGELDLRLPGDDPHLRAQLGLLPALVVYFQTSFLFALSYGKNLFTRECFDMLGCASPTVSCAIETLSRPINAEVVRQVKARHGKMFVHIMACSAKTLSETPTVKQNGGPTILLTQVSCQKSHYKPEVVDRNVVGNWLIGLGMRITSLSVFQDDAWVTAYYKNIKKHIDEFSGNVAWSFLNQTVFGFFSTYGWSNVREILWFNNYGQRSFHPDAGGCTYHWGPNYSVATYLLVNICSPDDHTCITLLSSVIPQGELQDMCQRLKELLIEEAGHRHESMEDPDAYLEKKQKLG